LVIFNAGEVVEGTWEVFEELPSVMLDTLDKKGNYDIQMVDDGFVILGAAEKDNWQYAMVEVSQLPNSEISEKSVAEFILKKFQQMSNAEDGTTRDTKVEPDVHRPDQITPKRKASKKNSLLIDTVTLDDGQTFSFSPPLGTNHRCRGDVRYSVNEEWVCGRYFFDHASKKFFVEVIDSEVVKWFKMFRYEQPDGESILVGYCMFSFQIKIGSPVADLKGNPLNGVFLINGYQRRVEEGTLTGL